MKNIKAIIFDLNGVFIFSKKLSDRFRDDFGVAEEQFIPALKKIMDEVRLPHAKDLYSYWYPYLQEWGVPLNENQFLTYWFQAENADEAMLTLAKEVKQEGVILFILSNNLRERAGYYSKQFPFLETLFTKVYYSWKTGYIKPDVRAYELVLKENHLLPEECLYFDDSSQNVSVALSLGIQSYVFSGAADVRMKLQEHRLL